MTDQHPNLSLLQRFDPNHLAACADILADDVVFHYFNPKLPVLNGDYIGHAGIGEFFKKLAQQVGRDFQLNLVSATPFGDELVVVHRKQSIHLDGQQLESDVVVVWRFVDGKIAEIWDIPSIHAVQVIDS